MARGRARWKNAIDPKLIIARLLQRVELSAPAISRAIRYHGSTEIISDDCVFDELVRPIRFKESRYLSAYEILRKNNVDGVNPGFDGDGVCLRSALVDDCIVHGHSLLPVNRMTGRILAYEARSLPLGASYPMPSPRAGTKVGGVAVAIPRHKNYYHLMIDTILPVISVILRRPEIFNEKITFISNEDYQPLDFFIKVLRETGFDAVKLKIKQYDSVVAQRYLVAKSMSRSKEHGYAFFEELSAISHIVERFIRDVQTPSRLYIPRTRTRIRNIANERSLRNELSVRGVSSFSLDWSNFIEQIAAFRRAELVVSPHGAALTNLIWGGNSNIVEIHASNARKTTYLHIASQNNWAYFPIIGTDEGKNQKFSVPIDEILGILKIL